MRCEVFGDEKQILVQDSDCNHETNASGGGNGFAASFGQYVHGDVRRS